MAAPWPMALMPEMIRPKVPALSAALNQSKRRLARLLSGRTLKTQEERGQPQRHVGGEQPGP